MDTVVVAGSWRIASEFARAVPGIRVCETHPGGGQYDCLSLVAEGVNVAVNREGSVHVLASLGGEHSPLLNAEEWHAMLLQPHGAGRIVEQIMSACGLYRPSPRPRTTPHMLVYRVVARLLASRMFDAETWDVRSQFLDTSGMGGGIRRPVPSPEMSSLPANQVWMVLRGESVLAWLWDGWAWPSDGGRINLMAAYRSGASIDDLVATVTRRRRAGAPPLPPVRVTGEQPIGEWT